jgi:hypothetical protein
MVRHNPDGSITVGVLRDEKKDIPAEKAEKPAPQVEKKPTKKKK